MTQALKEMCGTENRERIGTHKEGGSDKSDERRERCTEASGLLSDRFHIPDYIPDKEVLLSLSNLAVGVVLPDTDANRLLGAAESGRQSMESFISSIIQSNEINFWDPIHKLKI